DKVVLLVDVPVEELDVALVVRVQPQVQIDPLPVLNHSSVRKLFVDSVAGAIIREKKARQHSVEGSGIANLLVVHKREYVGVRVIGVQRVELPSRGVDGGGNAVEGRIVPRDQGGVKRIQSSEHVIERGVTA